MEIDKLLRVHGRQFSDKEVLEMIISNRVTHFIGLPGDGGVSAVGSKNFSVLADDILKFIEFKKGK